jgi:NADH dehydrogenase [ubiquinone] 1 alpha subcomplex assembly factor 5
MRPTQLARRVQCSIRPQSLSPCSRRTYAVQQGGAPTISVFSNEAKQQQRSRAAADMTESRATDYLRDEVAARLCSRLLDINRQFPKALDFGANTCNIARILTLPDPDPDSPSPVAHPLSSKIGHLTCADSNQAMLHRDQDEPFNKDISLSRHVLQSPETLPFEPNSFDLVLSSSSLHWINDLPSVLAQINNVLKPDAPFIAAMSGGDSLFELRGSLQLAEQDRLGGIGTHVSPLADVRDVGNLLTRAGFKLLTVDVDDIIVDYPTTLHLMRDLQAMGESNAALKRTPGPISRNVLLATEAIYKQLYGNDDGTIPATFRTIYMIGWKEGANQPKPLERGTGEINIKDILEGGGSYTG